VHATLDQIYGQRDDISFFGNMHPIDMLIATVGSYHLPIMTSISVDHVVDSKPSYLFNINISHLESTYFKALVHNVWNIVPHPRGVKGWFYGGRLPFVVQ